MGGLEAKSSLVLSPLIIVPTLFALLYEPTGRLAVMIASSLMFGFLFVTWYLVRKIPPVRDITFPSRIGIAIEDIDPRGRIKIGGEIWWAITRGWRIKKGDKVYIIDKRDLELIVVPVVECPNCGAEYPITHVPENCEKCGFNLSVVAIDALKKYVKEKPITT